jgi:protocatechuate 3,4-dioxygenase beta subunit
LLVAVGAGAGLLSWSSLHALTLTARQTLGPFYPVVPPATLDNDLTRVAGIPEVAQGTITDLDGRLLDANGRPIRNARIEIWQCDANGRYRHPRERAARRADPGFQGFGHAYTDAEGHYRFRTIRPAPYPGRTPHIHYAVFAGDERLLVTQMYVQGDPGNGADFIYNRLSPEQRQTVTVPLVKAVEGSGAELTARFDIVIANDSGATAAIG